MIIAEGIEEEDELNTLAAIGVHYGQGYLIGKPLCPKQLPEENISLNFLSRSRWINPETLRIYL